MEDKLKITNVRISIDENGREWRRTYFFHGFYHDIKVHFLIAKEMNLRMLEVFIHQDPKSPYWRYDTTVDMFYKPEIDLTYVTTIPYEQMDLFKDYIGLIQSMNGALEQLWEDFSDAYRREDTTALEEKYGWTGTAERISN